MTVQKVRTVAWRIGWIFCIYSFVFWGTYKENCPLLSGFYETFLETWTPIWGDNMHISLTTAHIAMVHLSYYPIIIAVLCFVFGKNLIRIRKSRLEGKSPSGLYYADCVLAAVHLIFIFILFVFCDSYR